MTGRRLGVSAAFVDGRLLPGDVEVADGRVTAVGLAGGGAGVAAPGLVDLQVNGFAGVDFLSDADDDAWREASRQLLRSGVTAFQPTLITAPPAALHAALERAARLAREPATDGARILGVHLEGPFLSPQRLGTHPPADRRDPDRQLLASLLAAGPVSMVTLAPELPGAGALIETLAQQGVVVSLGHSAAPAAVVHDAVARGARAVTHAFNAMGPIAGRDPGLAGVALTERRLTVMWISDGVHLAPETERLLWAAAGERAVLTSDAIAAAGVGDGVFALGSVEVTVRDGRATRADGTLAGGAGTVAGAVRRSVELGATLEQALAAATATPTRLVCGERPAAGLRPGARADLVVLDDALEVARVMLAGKNVEQEAPS